MGKLRTTLRDMRNFKDVVIGVGYGQFQHVLQYHTPLAYNAGTNGQNCDLYGLQTFAIVTGSKYSLACTHQADENFVRWLDAHFLKSFPDRGSVEAKASAKSIYPQMLYWHTIGAFNDPQFVRRKPDAYQFLKRWGTKLRPAEGANGAVRVYNFAGHKYYVLCDDTVITELEWFRNETDGTSI